MLLGADRGAFAEYVIVKAMGALGADETIDYEAQRFEEVVREVDVVLDLIAGESQARSWSVLKPGGILISTLGEPSEEAARKHGVRGVGYMAQANAAQFAEIARLINGGMVRPVLESTYPFSAAPQAEQRQESSHVQGKIVLELAA